jgi:hypothetical protein
VSGLVGPSLIVSAEDAWMYAAGLRLLRERLWRDGIVAESRLLANGRSSPRCRFAEVPMMTLSSGSGRCPSGQAQV